MSSGPPTKRSERLYGPIKRRRQRGRIKFESAKVSQMLKVSETTYLERASAAQPCGNAPNRVHRVHRPHRQRGRIKFEPRNVNQMETDGNAHLRCTGIAQPRGNDPKRSYGVIGPWRRRGRMKIVSVTLKIKCINGKKAQDGETTYLERAQAAQPLVNPLRRACRVIGPKGRHGRIKSIPTNVNQT